MKVHATDPIKGRASVYKEWTLCGITAGKRIVSQNRYTVTCPECLQKFLENSQQQESSRQQQTTEHLTIDGIPVTVVSTPGFLESLQPQFYIRTFKHRSLDGCVLWWGPNDCGYTSDLNGAGKYTAEQIAAWERHSEWSDENIAVPVDFVERSARIRRVVDPGDARNAIYSTAERLRAALAREAA